MPALEIEPPPGSAGAQFFVWTTLTEAGWARRPIAKEEARALLGGKDLNPHIWKRFSLILALVVVGVFGVSSAVAKSPSTNLNGHVGTQQAWIDYFNSTGSTISQLNALGREPLSASVVASTINLLKPLANSPDPTLNDAVASAMSLCQTNAASCGPAVDSAGRAYNNALNEAGREGLVHVIPASSP